MFSHPCRIVPGLFLLLILSAPIVAEVAAAENVFQPFVGEALAYDISFLWFDRLAEGRLHFSIDAPTGRYRAELEARTLGIAAWVTGNRKHRYDTLMELGSDGRMRTLVQESLIVKGEGKKLREKGKRYIFDYEARKVRMLRQAGAGFVEDTAFPMEAGLQPNDFLTVFFNFRAGRLGEIKAGADFTIPTFTRKGKAEIGIHVLTAVERKGLDRFPAHGILARVILDAEELDTAGGGVYVWFDEQGRPAQGIVENVLGLGDVFGQLRL
ncbi:MAG: hypothetical protein A2091_00720 [Desulfuromonadales bacterium GWD2_61_12]|nr:MAG: hypothetical protein A2091_00720 [Desulfuromonadales bacterium GWD2_61_12]OGR34005.1 MAG: hypothetical protein A2005_03100 [Desulfuromonadales bacterium GWC2_61_20]HAD03193.1 hypothetical protein [Desulfuromonas sp.]HBT82395.1 hypothetical protein [Desulfuromonas sp.]